MEFCDFCRILRQCAFPKLLGGTADKLHKIPIHVRLIGIAAFRSDCRERNLRLPAYQSCGVLHPDDFAEQLRRIADGFFTKVMDIACAIACSLRKLRHAALPMGAEDAFGAIAEQILFGIFRQAMRLQEMYQKLMAFFKGGRRKKFLRKKIAFGKNFLQENRVIQVGGDIFPMQGKGGTGRKRIPNNAVPLSNANCVGVSTEPEKNPRIFFGLHTKIKSWQPSGIAESRACPSPQPAIS